jgi:hypothetical protein
VEIEKCDVDVEFWMLDVEFWETVQKRVPRVVLRK